MKTFTDQGEVLDLEPFHAAFSSLTVSGFTACVTRIHVTGTLILSHIPCCFQENGFIIVCFSEASVFLIWENTSKLMDSKYK